MNTHAGCAVLIFCISTATLAADRYVADAMTVESLPTGETVTRLISQNRQTVRQFWVESSYGTDGTLVVFDGQHRTPAPSGYVRQKQNSSAHAGKFSDTQTNDRLATTNDKQ